MSPNRNWLFTAVALVSLSLVRPPVAAAQAAGDAKDRQIQELQAQVKRLEARLAELEKKVAPILANQGGGGAEAAAARPAAQNAQVLQQKNQIKARERMRADRKKHKPDELDRAE